MYISDDEAHGLEEPSSMAPFGWLRNQSESTVSGWKLLFMFSQISLDSFRFLQIPHSEQGLCMQTFTRFSAIFLPPENDALFSDVKPHFLQPGAESSTTNFLLPAFMVSWMAVPSQRYCTSIWKTEQASEVRKKNNINSLAQPIGKTTGTGN